MDRATLALIAVAGALTAAGCERASVGGVASTAPAYRDTSETSFADARTVAVSNAYLGAAVRDLMGERVALVLLSEPGSCPGHFDLRPSQVRQLRSCELLVRFGFQSRLDDRLRDLGPGAPRVVAVEVEGGMCEPAGYAAACRQLAAALVGGNLLAAAEAEERLAAIAARMEALDAWAEAQIREAGLSGAAVLASVRQADFCRGLGLRVAGTFSAADTAQPSQVNRAVQAGEAARVRLVVANLPEGRQLADALAARLGATVVVLGNFPASPEPAAFDRLVRDNVALLAEAAR